eukprot:s6081_g4.t1
MPVPGSGKQQIWPDVVWCFTVSWLRQRRYKSPVHLKLLRYWRPYLSAHARKDSHLHELLQTDAILWDGYFIPFLSVITTWEN